MGIFRAVFSAVKNAKSQKKLYSEYKSMSNEQLIRLSDDELYTAVNCICSLDVDDEKLDIANEIQRAFYVIDYFNLEVNNGGLCQFFVNSSRVCAPYISNSLEMIGAEKTKNLFDSFVAKNSIDLKNLDSFIIDDIDKFEEQTKRYPFDDFDNSYYKIEDIDKLLVSFAKKNINELIAR